MWDAVSTCSTLLSAVANSKNWVNRPCRATDLLIISAIFQTSTEKQNITCVKWKNTVLCEFNWDKNKQSQYFFSETFVLLYLLYFVCILIVASKIPVFASAFLKNCNLCCKVFSCLLYFFYSLSWIYFHTMFRHFMWDFLVLNSFLYHTWTEFFTQTGRHVSVTFWFILHSCFHKPCLFNLTRLDSCSTSCGRTVCQLMTFVRFQPQCYTWCKTVYPHFLAEH